ncbi:MAG: ATP-grasp domain-containing protein [Bacteroidota bacterium]|nr:ATP-grasp domain-containing protein [Bacteroidota bacterium]MDP4234771.1 ATP-grasp domain-containing protein [Bacteroidota bacterium]MDP4244162.1 ATP-grasp domain-containing protein [Bacteroidota bacterium]MDP4289324.1 ATP-grasp domain-containing protein [Bacteroidota bacterium]
MRVGLLANIKPTPERQIEQLRTRYPVRTSTRAPGSNSDSKAPGSKLPGTDAGARQKTRASERLTERARTTLDDLYAEWDSPETIEAVRKALVSHPDVECEVIEAVPDRAIDRLLIKDLDIVFNLAEGFVGAAREAQFPALLEMLDIPYTGSGPLALATALDKARTKEVLSYHGVPVARFVTSGRAIESIRGVLPGSDFPFIVKPISEGSSKGIRNSSFVTSLDAMNREIERIATEYSQPAIIEEFLPGREFTVAVIGNGPNARVLPIVEINFGELPEEANRIYSYEAKWVYDVATNPLHIFTCPADTSDRLRNEIENVVLRTYEVLDCRDWSRIDVRLDARGRVNVIEVNPLPGILPNPEENSCFPKAARAAGLTYESMLLSVLKSGCERYGIPFQFEPKFA